MLFRRRKKKPNNHENEIDKMIRLVQEGLKNQTFLKKQVSTLQDSLDTLRLYIKYLIFDIEATRRENVELRKLLEEKNN
jgi:hypothetical protein